MNPVRNLARNDWYAFPVAAKSPKRDSAVKAPVREIHNIYIVKFLYKNGRILRKMRGDSATTKYGIIGI